MKMIFARWALIFVVAAVLFLLPVSALAHCDTVDGPVVTAAKQALDGGDVTPVLKWIKPEHEVEIRAAFKQALEVRSLGPEARAMADNYFFETLVRVHRAGEGEPYTGLKTAAPAAGIALADEAIATGSAESLVRSLTDELAAGIRERFRVVQQTKQHADQSVDAGRRFVAAYVDFIHYVEGWQQQAHGPASHHGTDAAMAEAHD